MAGSRRWPALVAVVVVGLVQATMLSGTATASSATGYAIVSNVAVRYNPFGVAVDTSTHRVYVTNDQGSVGTVAVIDESGDVRAGTTAATIAVGSQPTGVAVDPSTHEVFVANRGYTYDTPGTVSVIDGSGKASAGKVTATIPVGISPSAVAVDPSTHTVYVVNSGMTGIGTVSVIDESGDARSGRVTATIPVGVQPDAVAVDPSTHTVYVVDGGHNTPGAVSVIDESGDAKTGGVAATIPVGVAPKGVAVDPTSHTVYVTDFGSYGSDGTVSVIDESGDAITGRVTATLPVAEHPYSVAVDPTSHTVYVTSSNYGDGGMLSVIDEHGDADTGKVTASIGLGGRVVEDAVDPLTHEIYVAADESLLGIASRPAVDMTMTISAPKSATGGSQFEAWVAVTDNGPGTADSAVTNLLVPAGLTVVVAPGATFRSGTLVWNDRSLPAGGSDGHPVTFAVVAGARGTVAIGGVTICSAYYDPRTANNAAVATVRLA